MPRSIAIIGAPTSAGAYSAGQEDGPRALRAAGLVEGLRARGLDVHDTGDTRASAGGPIEVARRR